MNGYLKAPANEALGDSREASDPRGRRPERSGGTPCPCCQREKDPGRTKGSATWPDPLPTSLVLISHIVVGASQLDRMQTKNWGPSGMTYLP
jgi:hypothetical protein